MKKLAFLAVVVVFLLSVTCGIAPASVLDPEWVEESASPFSLETEAGKFFIGYDVVMRNRETRAAMKLFESFETGEVILSGKKELNSNGEIKNIVQLEPGGPVGVHAEFDGVIKESRLTGFLVRLHDEEGKDIERRLFHPDFERITSADPMDGLGPNDPQCVRGKKTVSSQEDGVWQELICGPRFLQISWFYPFGSDQVLVKNWSTLSSVSGGGEEIHTFFAMQTRSGKWAITEMVHDTVLSFDYLKQGGKVVAFEVILRDSEGNKTARRMYRSSLKQ